MLKALGRQLFMVELGVKYIKIFSKTFFHPFISLKQGYKQLSHERQNYSNKVLEFLNIEVKVYGKVPTQNHILYAINHRSLLDIIVMESIFSQHNKNGTWIAKQELFDAVYGKFFEYSGCISVDLENGRGLIKFFKKIKHTLNQIDDFNIYIFPEGERFSGEGVTSFQSGAAKIAKSNKLSVVNVHIDDTLEKVLSEAPFKEKKIVEVHFDKILTHENLEENYKMFMQKVKNG